ncbi:MAG TPA: hypothetical protein DCR55_08000 [Lentisphaeria bacterium]|nr:hypothetical protein [Lentisphaeria bacterium]
MDDDRAVWGQIELQLSELRIFRIQFRWPRRTLKRQQCWQVWAINALVKSAINSRSHFLAAAV